MSRALGPSGGEERAAFPARLPLARARGAVLVAAVESVDPHGELLPPAAREEATRLARAAGEGIAAPERLAAQVSARSERLVAHLGRSDPVVAHAARGIPRGVLVAAALLPAVLYGLGRSALGPGRTIDLFRNPLIALALWNLAVFALTLTVAGVRALRPRRPRRASPERHVGAGDDGHAADDASALERAAPRPPLLASRLGGALLALGLGRGTIRGAERTLLGARAIREFSARWRRIAAAPLAATGRLVLHSAALILLAATVGEAYLLGLFIEYTVTWETTLLTDAQIGRLVEVIYGLPAALLGREASLPPAGADAAPWIHLLALAVLLYGALPRALLLAATLRARRRARSVVVPVAPALARRLGAAAATGFARALVLPYGAALPVGIADRLRALLLDTLGASAVVDLAPPLPYGETGPEPVSAGAGGASAADDLCRIIVFSLAQTPESEVHGALARSLAARAVPAVAVVEGSGFARRFGGDAEGRARLAERRRAWDRALAETGIAVAHLDLSSPPDDAEFAEIARAFAESRREGARR